MMRRIATLLLFCEIIGLSGCGKNELRVQRLVAPDYPTAARIANMQGTVEVGVQIGADGRVVWAHGSGSNSTLIEAAENNAKQWTWGPFPQNFTFPFYHEIYYTYRLEGLPAFVIINPPNIKTELPNRIEIVARPFVSDDSLEPLPPGRQ